MPLWLTANGCRPVDPIFMPLAMNEYTFFAATSLNSFKIVCKFCGSRSIDFNDKLRTFIRLSATVKLPVSIVLGLQCRNDVATIRFSGNWRSRNRTQSIDGLWNWIFHLRSRSKPIRIFVSAFRCHHFAMQVRQDVSCKSTIGNQFTALVSSVNCHSPCVRLTGKRSP